MRGALCVAIIGWVSASPAAAFTLDGTDPLRLGWDARELTFQVVVTGCPLSSETLGAAIDRALAVWNGVVTSDLTLRRGEFVEESITAIKEGTAPRPPYLICDPDFQVHTGQDGQQVAGVGSTSYHSHTKRIVFGYLLLNAEAGKKAAIQTKSSVTLDVVIAHEIGHILGLGHTSDENSLMFFDASAKQELRLGQDDMDGVTYLYPREEPQDGIYGCGTITNLKSGGRGGNGGTMAALEGMLWFLGAAAFVRLSNSRLLFSK